MNPSSDPLWSTFCCLCLSRERFLSDLCSIQIDYGPLHVMESAWSKYLKKRNCPSRQVRHGYFLECFHKSRHHLRQSQFADRCHSPRKVCWECKAIIKKLNAFQRMAVESFELMNKIIGCDFHEIDRFSRMICKSNLAKNSISIYTYDPTIHTCDLNTATGSVFSYEDISIKKENSSDDSNIVTAEPLQVTETDNNYEQNNLKVNKKHTNETKSIHKRPLHKTTKIEPRKETTEVLFKTSDTNVTPEPIFKRSVKRSGYAQRKIDKDKFEVLKLDEGGIVKSRMEDVADEKYLKLPHKCEMCIIGFKKTKQLEEHNVKHDPTFGDFSCDVCHLHFASERVLRTHKRRHALRYACKTCGEQGRYIRHLWKHYAEKHGQSVYTCPICGLALRSAGAYRYHREGHKERAECDYCGRTFQSRAGLFSHIVTHMKLPPVSCPICRKSVRNKYALAKHVSRHSAARDQRHYCSPCQIHFSSKYSYMHHLKSSSKHIRPENLRFSCSECDKRFYTDKRRTEHYNSVHLKETEHQCSRCLKSFCNKSTLRAHVRGVHERVRAPRDKICHHCGKAFYCSASLRAHVRTHTGERPYACTLCPAAFTQSSSLRTHRARLHSAPA